MVTTMAVYQQTSRSENSSVNSPWECIECKEDISREKLYTLIKSLEAKVKENVSKEEVENLLTHLSKLLHTNHYLIILLKEKWVKFEHNDKESLEKALEYLSQVIKIRKVVEPGLTLSLGENVKLLNQLMLKLGKQQLQAKEITQEQFIRLAMGAAKNIKFAKKCFEEAGE